MSDFEAVLAKTSESNAATEEGSITLLETLNEQAADLVALIEAHPFTTNSKKYAAALPTSPAASEMGQSGTFIGNAKTVIVGAQKRAQTALQTYEDRRAAEQQDETPEDSTEAGNDEETEDLKPGQEPPETT